MKNNYKYRIKTTKDGSYFAQIKKLGFFWMDLSGIAYTKRWLTEQEIKKHAQKSKGTKTICSVYTEEEARNLIVNMSSNNQ